MAEPRYIYDDHGHDVMDSDCVKCWMRVAHQSQMQSVLLVGQIEALMAREEPPEALREIIERIMTQHWDMASCPCWICVEGREVGCRPREMYQAYKHPEQRRPPVRVMDHDWV